MKELKKQLVWAGIVFASFAWAGLTVSRYGPEMSLFRASLLFWILIVCVAAILADMGESR